ncbi:MAG: hypothetical protein WC728_01960 [Elusimicrobiota bacterium]
MINILALALCVPAVGLEVPPVGETKAVPADFVVADLGAESRTLYEEAKAWADKIIRADKELDGLYESYRTSLSNGAVRKIEASRKERDYYASVWRSIVEPAKDFKADDPRVTPILQALHYYLVPVPERVQRLDAAKTAAAKVVERSAAAWRAQTARLHEDDRKLVEEFGLTGKPFAKVEEAVPADRRESKEYMGWVRSAYDKTTEWVKAVKVNESLGEQVAWVRVDYQQHSKLVKTLMEKKLGTLAVTEYGGLALPGQEIR